LEGSTSEKTAEGTLSTITGTKNDPPIQLDTALNQKAFPLFCLYYFLSFFNVGIEL
jgi:hypothetical protein